MIQICRAEDGEIFQVNATLWDIEKLGSLEIFLHQEIGIEQDAILAYLSDGRRLWTENIRDLAGAQDQTIYVFNKYYLDEGLDEVLRLLHVQPPLQPPIEDSIAATPPFRPSQLGDSYMRAAHAHHQSTTHTFATLKYQQTALRIASGSLDLNVLAITDVFDGVAAGAQRELDKQATLLAGIDADLAMIARIHIHRDFVSPSVRQAMDSGERGRTLGDYVSNAKMGDVQATMKRLTDGTSEVRLALSDSRTGHMADTEGILQELRQFDTAIRNNVSSIVDLKNMFTEQCMRALRQVSLLNHDIVDLPPTLTALQASFRAKNSFSHIQRLHSMMYAYGATVVEVVRRKEFARFFYQRAQVILEVMAKLSAAERKRRQVYRGEIHGQLPFDTRGMDDAAPVIDFSPTGGNAADSPYTVERSDVQEFLNVLDDLERYAETLDDGDGALVTIRNTRANLQKLVTKMDGLETGFDRIAEKTLLSSSRLALSRRRLSDADDHVFHELTDQLREIQQSKAEQERGFAEERQALQDQITQLTARLDSTEGDSSTEHERADRLERELHQARSRAESEATSRRIIEERHRELLADVERQRQELTQALAEATSQTKAAEVLRQQLAQARTEADDIKALEARSSAKLTSLLEDQQSTLKNLEEARCRGENLEAQIRAVREEGAEVKRSLDEAGKEKDRLLSAQASEHDRQMRDYVAEADGDRAVLEHQFFELRAEIEDMERQVKEATAQMEMKDADAAGLREELQRLEVELRDARQVESVLREDLRAGRASQSDYEAKVEQSNRLVAQLLDVSIAYRTAHFKAINLAQTATAHPSMSKSIAHLGDLQALSASTRLAPLGLDEPSPLDTSDPAGAVEILRSFDQDHFLEVVGKTGSTIRKWQKQCKEYRERAKGKISFRNFAKGDLALFLPTRNSVSKPWAAFNVSFPHYFLQATGHLAEQLKTREWIVARITSITERVVDPKDPTSNPYDLSDGVKYYMLEVEDWTQPSSSKRRVTPRKASGEKDELPTPLAAPPENEVEESFQATRAPNSRLFPVVRSRANSSPTAGPSSLSRLLAQATAVPELPPLDPIPSSPTPARTPSPHSLPAQAHSPPPLSHPPRTTVPSSSPLRPGSRASRLSSSSRFSSRAPPFASAGTAAPALAKAAPTTALTEAAPSPGTPSPADSASEGMASIMHERRRTASYHIPHAAGSPLATQARDRAGAGALASLWSASFSRRRRDSRTPQPGAEGEPPAETSARDLLQRF
ncbi:hypothetical protein FA95DRAFT_921642 [Auriscalpium vulgare]|uniref:Uncharacterized protein n=1 Tax=Auriscalpium vulgare TaxID=40419 RepID=A0ACB8RYN4_9AGAM|nr:hypothetical protein FA95DRAFT_921642 [Auriscalpium vulgare]